MNLETEINSKLWKVIARHYESKSYKNAILDALHYLTDIIREKADVEGDGAKMVNAAFAGTSPRIRINKLQSQSDKDAQLGLFKILEGLYIGIRNPRSHEQSEDEQTTADTIILLINYILGVIDTSKGPFVLDDWLNRIYDPDFYPSKRYAEILVTEIPPKKYINTFIELYRNRLKVDGQNLSIVFTALINKIGKDNISEVLDVISDELRSETKVRALTHFFQCFPSNLWPLIAEDARLRIENKLLLSVKNGSVKPEFDENGDKTYNTREALGTWATKIINYMTAEHKAQFYEILYNKCGPEEGECEYVIKFFLEQLPEIEKHVPYYNKFEPEPNSIFQSLYIHYHDYSPRAQSMLDESIYSLPETWKPIIEEQRKKMLKEISPEDIPF